MRFPFVLCSAAVALATTTNVESHWEQAVRSNPLPAKRDLLKNDYFVVRAEDPKVLLADVVEAMPIKDHWLVSVPKSGRLSARDLGVPLHQVYDNGLSQISRRAPVHDKEDRDSANGCDGISETVELLESREESYDKVIKDLQITDPKFQDQWHIYNREFAGRDMNVVGVWEKNITGRGVCVAIVDDGLDYEHHDLKKNYFAEGSWDYNAHRPEPKHELSIDGHGTRCAGEVAAERNDVCGVGIAYDSRVAGIRILSGELLTSDEARALNHRIDANHVFSCSWGPTDDGRTVMEPPALVKRALVNGIEHGRNDRGSIYVFAAGNGHSRGDNCNYDGYTNSIYSITVASIDIDNNHPYYSESCSANMAVTYSSNAVKQITTTNKRLQDVDSCTDTHTGTSASAPIAAGILALVLEARPELTWRDMQYVVRTGSVPFKIPSATPEYNWTRTWDNKLYHNDYGYGLLDATSVVEVAKTWELVKPQSWFFSEPAGPVEIGSSVAESVIKVSSDDLKNANFERLEQVNVVVNLNHSRRGALSYSLVSPSGFEVVLAKARPRDISNAGLVNWTFTSVAHWGEKPDGEWKLKVHGADETSGTLTSWQLKLWGECKDAKKAKRYSDEWDKYESKADLFVGGETSTSSTSAEPEPTEAPPASNNTTESGQDAASTSAASSSSNHENIATGITDPVAGNSTATESAVPNPGNDASKDNKKGSSLHWLWWLAGLGLIAITAVGVIVRRRAGEYVAIDRLVEPADFVLDDSEFDYSSADERGRESFELDDMSGRRGLAI